MSSRNFSRTFKKPRRPYEKERMHNELKVVGEFGLKNKRELWTAHFFVSKLRKAARELLMLPEKDTKRVFEGTALLRRLTKLGVLDEDKQKLDYVLELTPADLLERRLQTQVYKSGKAKSIHHARTLINHRHIALGSQMCNQPGLLVWKENEKLIRNSDNSVFTTNKLGRKRRLRAKAGKKQNNDDDFE